MKVLILLEDERYTAIAEQIKKSSVAKVEISNIDFNIKKSLMAAQAVIIFGDEEPYNYVKSEYAQIIEEKLLFTTYESAKKLDFEIAIHITSGVVICGLPAMNRNLRQVVEEVTHQLFEGALKIMLTTAASYEDIKKTIGQLENNLQTLVESNTDKLPLNIIKEIFNKFI